jgi:hypothetical protein
MPIQLSKKTQFYFMDLILSPMSRTMKILSFFPTYKLVCLIAVDNGRGHEIPGSETEDSYNNSKCKEYHVCISSIFSSL